ncbi:MAG: hypothetical protein CMP39_03735 [Rickettsiales bacterium]|nr:hypothetical protein [Rickettsiales bacterium]
MSNITVFTSIQKKENQNNNERKRTASSLERVSAIKTIKTNATIWINEKLKEMDAENLMSKLIQGTIELPDEDSDSSLSSVIEELFHISKKDINGDFFPLYLCKSYLDWAAEYENLPMIKALVENGATLTNPNVLKRACDYRQESLSSGEDFKKKEDEISILEFLIENGAEISPDALQYAANQKNLNMVEFLCEHIKNKDFDISNALYFSVENNKIDITQVLLNSDIHIDFTIVPSAGENLLLNRAIYNLNFEMATLLIDHGHDVNLRNSDSDISSPLTQALTDLDSYNDDMVNIIVLLIESGAILENQNLTSIFERERDENQPFETSNDICDAINNRIEELNRISPINTMLDALRQREYGNNISNIYKINTLTSALKNIREFVNNHH